MSDDGDALAITMFVVWAFELIAAFISTVICLNAYQSKLLFSIAITCKDIKESMYGGLITVHKGGGAAMELNSRWASLNTEKYGTAYAAVFNLPVRSQSTSSWAFIAFDSPECKQSELKDFCDKADVGAKMLLGIAIAALVLWFITLVMSCACTDILGSKTTYFGTLNFIAFFYFGALVAASSAALSLRGLVSKSVYDRVQDVSFSECSRGRTSSSVEESSDFSALEGAVAMSVLGLVANLVSMTVVSCCSESLSEGARQVAPTAIAMA